MLDPQDELYDKRLARHLVSLYYRAAVVMESEFMVNSSHFLLAGFLSFKLGWVVFFSSFFFIKELDVLRNYMAFARQCTGSGSLRRESRGVVSAVAADRCQFIPVNWNH